MGVVEELAAAVGALPGDEGKKAVVVAFLKAAGPVVEGLGPVMFEEVMGVVAGGGDARAVADAVVAKMDEAQLAALLAATAMEMKASTERHVAERMAAREAMEVLRGAALAVVARVLVGML